MSGKGRGIAVGLTGNIGSGKSSVLNMFAKLGCRVLSTDGIAHDLLYTPSIKKLIRDIFGNLVESEAGRIDRAKLAKIVFSDKKKRAELENILHPAIKASAEAEINRLPKGSVLIVEAPLLFESGWDVKLDKTIMVTCPRAIREKRYCEKYKCSPESFALRDSAQQSEEAKTPLSTFSIDNSGDPSKTLFQVKNILKTIRDEM